MVLLVLSKSDDSANLEKCPADLSLATSSHSSPHSYWKTRPVPASFLLVADNWSSRSWKGKIKNLNLGVDFRPGCFLVHFGQYFLLEHLEVISPLSATRLIKDSKLKWANSKYCAVGARTKGWSLNQLLKNKIISPPSLILSHPNYCCYRVL